MNNSDNGNMKFQSYRFRWEIIDVTIIDYASENNLSVVNKKAPSIIVYLK